MLFSKVESDIIVPFVTVQDVTATRENSRLAEKQHVFSNDNKATVV